MNDFSFLSAMPQFNHAHPVFIVFEAGATHDGLASAKQLVNMAKSAGANAIKFQMVNAERLVPDPLTMFSYEVLADRASGRMERVEESLQAILKRRELKRDEWRELINYAHAQQVEFFSTATDFEAMEFLFHAGCQCVKIASGDINHFPLLRQAASFPWIVQIDTGNATLGEVEQAVDVLEGAGCHRIIINHCPSGYPAHMDGVNLRVISTLRQLFPYPVAFSDHTPGAIMDVAAIALGADILEKTVTLNRMVRSPEHVMSLEPHEAAAFVSSMRDVERALGMPRRKMSAQEKVLPQVARRSIVLARDLNTGEVLTPDACNYVRPGDGLPPSMLETIAGKHLRHAQRCGHKLRLSDLDD